MNPHHTDEEEDELFDSRDAQHFDSEDNDDGDANHERNKHEEDDESEAEEEDVWEDDENDSNRDERDDEDEPEGGNPGVELILEQDDGSTGTRYTTLSARQILALFSGGYLRGISSDIDDEVFFLHQGRRATNLDPNRFPEVPSKKGIELMSSGLFGASYDRGPLQKRKKLHRRLLERELARGDYALRNVNEGMIAQGLLPSKEPEMIINYEDPAYSGQFSNDGNFFFACVKDFRVRMYDTSNPYNWHQYKTVRYPGAGHWTLTDASLSPNNMWLAYTSLCPQVALAPTDPKDKGDPYFLNLEMTNGTAASRGFRIYSIRFSGDGRELVAGASRGGIVVFDIESRTTLHYVEGHDDDVNAVCFADASSPHVLYSGSDDSTIKVWDRRSMAENRPAGAFVGHIEGLTYVDSKGDGRYILSNGKDQTMKLWDLRMAMSSEQFAEKNPTRYARSSGFDYRWGNYNDDNWIPHPDDNSVVTFRGHKVLQTLIRCHFSPPGSTNSRYVYSGSHDGKVWIYNLDATVAGVVDVKAGTDDTRPRHHGRTGKWQTCVRDASWHPHAPMMVASALNGWDQLYGTCSVHSFNEFSTDEGDPIMGVRVDDKLSPDPFYHLKVEPTGRRFWS